MLQKFFARASWPRSPIFSCAILVLLLTCPLSALSQDLEDLDPGSIKPPAQTVAIDSRGVDIASGTHKVPGMQVGIGSGSSRLFSDPGRSRFNMDNHVGTIEKIVIKKVVAYTTNGQIKPYWIDLPIGEYFKVDIGGGSEILKISTGQSVTGDGGSISCSGTICTYKHKSGMIAIFDMSLCNNCKERYSPPDPYQSGLVRKITKPDGEVLNYFYRRHNQYRRDGLTWDMPSAVVSSLGWMLKYYFSDVSNGEGLVTYGDRSITAINTRVEHCNPVAQQCNVLSNTWPVAHMKLETDVWTARDNSSYHRTAITEVTAPGETKSDFHFMKYGMFSGNSAQAYRTAEGVRSSYTIAGYIYNISYHQYETLYGRGVNKVLNATIADETSTYDFKYPGNVIGADGTYVVEDVYDRVNSFTDKLGRTTSYEYEGGYKNRIKKVTKPNGSSTEYTYDGRGNITYIHEHPAGGGSPLITSTEYWTCNSSNQKYCNKPKSTTDANGATTSYTYYAVHGGINTITKPSVNVTVNGATTTVTPVVKHSYTAYRPYSYDSTGVWKAADVPVYRLTNISQCRSASTCSGTSNELIKTIHYDVNQNLLPAYEIVASGDGSISLRTDFEYDIYGNQVKRTGPHPKDETYTFYDLQQRVIGTIGPNSDGKGRVGTFIDYNADGQVTYTKTGILSGTTLSALESMPAKTEKTTTYDRTTGLAKEKVTEGIDVERLVVNMSYDSEFRLECEAIRVTGWGDSDACHARDFSNSTGAVDQVTKYEYDVAGALKKVITGYDTDDVRTDHENVYNVKGQLEKKIDGNGNVTLYSYDAFGRLLKTTYPSKTSAGNVNSADYNFTTYEGTRAKTVRLRNGTVVTFGYDAWGRTTSKTSTSNGTFGRISESFGYDNFNNMTSHTNTSTGIGSTTMTASFNALGWKKSETTALGTVSYGHDQYGRRNRLTWPDEFFVTYDYGNSLLLQHIKEQSSIVLASFGYDAHGRKDSLTRANDVVTSYGYDSFSRLTDMATGIPGSIASGDYSVAFEHSPASQVTSKTETVRGNLNASYIYSRQAESKSYTPNGLNQITNWSGTTLLYDANGNTEKIGSKAYTYNNDNLLLTAGGSQLSYDAKKRLYKVGSTCFLYDGQDLIAETNCSGTVLNRYVHGPNIDDPIVWYAGSGTGAKRYYAEDYLGSIIGITDSSGSAYAINSYDEYGIPATTNVGRFQFTGQMWLAEVGLYYYKARFYHPQLGRFMQTDPIGYGDGVNWYAYVGNDPVNGLDPSGMYTCKKRENVQVCEGTRAEVDEMKKEMKGYRITNATEGFGKVVKDNAPDAGDITRDYIESNRDKSSQSFDAQRGDSAVYSACVNNQRIKDCMSRLDEYEKMYKQDKSYGKDPRAQVFMELLREAGKQSLCVANNPCDLMPYYRQGIAPPPLWPPEL